MATDFFGYNRTVGKNTDIASSEYAKLAIGSQVNLCQSVNVQYGQEVRPIYTVGSPNVYFVSGHAQGSIDFDRLAGKGGFWANLQNKQCGIITGLNVTSGAEGCYGAGGRIQFDGATIKAIGLRITAGAIEITESASIMIASLN